MTNPFTIAAAAALIPLAVILGIQARRKKAEKQRSVLRDNAGAELDKLIAGVKSHHIQPEDALSQAAQIKQDYTDQVAQLKDGKTRKIAMNEWNEPNILWRKMDDLQRAGNEAGADSERAKRILPEFADGGYIRSRRGGMMAILGEGGHDEFVLSTDPSKAQNTAGLLAGFLAKAPAVAQATVGNVPFSIAPVINIEIMQDAEGMIKTQVTKSEGVQNAIVKVVNNATKNKQLNFPTNRGL
jgi:hypothetical protein